MNKKLKGLLIYNRYLSSGNLYFPLKAVVCILFMSGIPFLVIGFLDKVGMIGTDSLKSAAYVIQLAANALVMFMLGIIPIATLSDDYMKFLRSTPVRGKDIVLSQQLGIVINLLEFTVISFILHIALRIFLSEYVISFLVTLDVLLITYILCSINISIKFLGKNTAFGVSTFISLLLMSLFVAFVVLIPTLESDFGINILDIPSYILLILFILCLILTFVFYKINLRNIKIIRD